MDALKILKQRISSNNIALAKVKHQRYEVLLQVRKVKLQRMLEIALQHPRLTYKQVEALYAKKKYTTAVDGTKRY